MVTPWPIIGEGQLYFKSFLANSTLLEVRLGILAWQVRVWGVTETLQILLEILLVPVTQFTTSTHCSWKYSPDPHIKKRKKGRERRGEKQTNTSKDKWPFHSPNPNDITLTVSHITRESCFWMRNENVTI